VPKSRERRSDLGLYATDLTLNLLDPNDTAQTNLGAALVLDLDDFAQGTGIVGSTRDCSLGRIGPGDASGGGERDPAGLFWVKQVAMPSVWKHASPPGVSKRAFENINVLAGVGNTKMDANRHKSLIPKPGKGLLD